MQDHNIIVNNKIIEQSKPVYLYKYAALLCNSGARECRTCFTTDSVHQNRFL